MLQSFSTGGVADDDRVDYWRDVLHRVLTADCRIEPQRGETFDLKLASFDYSAFRLIDVCGTGHTSTRRGSGAPDAATVVFQLEGFATLSDGRTRTARLAPGDACIVPIEGNIEWRRTGRRYRQAMVDLPIEELDTAAPDWRLLPCTALSGSRAPVQAACDLMRFAASHTGLLGPACRDHLAATTLDLFGKMLTRDTAAAAPNANESRVAAYHRYRIEQYVLDNLRDPDLSVPRIAKDLNLSVRYVHKLFASAPLNVMQWAMEQRLRACQREIARRGARPISDVAFAWGFNSASHFSRAFKRQFGVCPSAV